MKCQDWKKIAKKQFVIRTRKTDIEFQFFFVLAILIKLNKSNNLSEPNTYIKVL